MTASIELAVVNSQNAVEIFTKGGLDAILGSVEASVRAMTLDGSTAAGRDEIRSVAYKVTRTKTALDAEAKKLTEGWRTATAQVNAERKRSQDRLDALAEEVRAPLTAFENKEKHRIAAHEEALSEQLGLLAMLRSYPHMEAALLEDHLKDFALLNADRNWEEFSGRAARQRSEINDYLTERITARRKYDADQEELDRLRAEESERQIRERERRAAEAARIEAERHAKEAADAEARRVIEAARKEESRVKAEAERVRAENERAQREAEAKSRAEQNAKLDAERRLRESEAARIAADNKAKSDLKAAAEKAEQYLRDAQEKAKRDADAAIAKERDRMALQRKVEEESRLKRESDEKLRAKIRAEIREDFAQYADDPITAMMDGKVRHIRVIY